MKVDFDELDGLKRWYGTQAGRVRQATAGMLNHHAFGTRTQAIRRINDTMVVRNSKFVSGRLKVKRASDRKPVSRQIAWTFSVAKARFTGWKEQEFGTKDKRTRYATLAARKHDPSKQIRPIVRFKPKNKILTRNDYGMSAKTTPGQFLAAALRKKENKMIRIKSTVYKRKRNKFEAVQILDKPKQPKRNRWMLTARNKYFQKTDLDALWRREYGRTIGKPPKR